MEILNLILHIDESLKSLIDAFGIWTYVIVFLIIFAETGLVVTPFLPGDSLLFVLGAFAGGGLLNVWVTYVVLLIAAILGDSVNYWIGHKIGVKAFANPNSKIFKQAYLQKTEKFYEKYGGKTIIIARFVPIVRTFAPFVAGVGKMDYSKFFLFNIVGGFIWVTVLVFLGFFFGGLDIIKHNFEKAIIVIILLSLLPMIYEYIVHLKEKKKEKIYKKSEMLTSEEIVETFKAEKLD